jgi:hypothetical protein
MKLRCQTNSLRLRLKRGEVAQLAESGRLEETITLGPGPHDVLRYVLETSPSAKEPTARFGEGVLVVCLPETIARTWAASEQVGIEAWQPAAPGNPLQILIEKDFACLDRSDADNVDTYPHPQAEAEGGG